MTPSFDVPVAPGGYAWWYLDAFSDDGSNGLTLIAFVGSVFSPYYARARRRAGGVADPANHCALNVALYTGPGKRGASGWTMTERGSAAVDRSKSQFRIGPSSLEWRNDRLTIEIDEVTVPWPSRVRGTVVLRPNALGADRYPLDAAGRHVWCPIAPCSQVEVDLSQPALHWTGRGYLDCNMGQRPLEQDFERWNWSRAALSAGRSAMLYDVDRRDGSSISLALEVTCKGDVEAFAAPLSATLPQTGWRMDRRTRSDAEFTPRIAQTLEDAPFYSRSVLRTRLLGEDATAVHESLSMRRWSSPLVQMMLPFRMPRRSGSFVRRN